MSETSGLLPVRDDLAEVAPYRTPARAPGLRLDSNESPYPPPPAFVDELAAALQAESLNRYPDAGANDLLQALSDATGWGTDGLWVANGSNEVLLHLFLAFGGPARTSLTFEPTYSLHTLVARVAGTRTVSLPRGEGFTAPKLPSSGERPDIVMLCSPNNPTGGVEPLDTVRELLEPRDRLVVVDEAYIDFAPEGTSVSPLLADHPNLVIVRTFSKAWRLAGVRLGYLLAHPAVVEGLARVRLPYGLTSLAQQAGLSALRHEGETRETVAKIVAERDRIAFELGALGLVTYPSHSNFVLFEVADPVAAWDALAAEGIYVRRFRDVPGLERALRVTAGLPEEVDAFLAAMREVVWHA